MCFLVNPTDSIRVEPATLNFVHKIWPPKPTALGASSRYFYLDFNKQSEWSTDEWKEYGRFLEEQGQCLIDELIKTRNELGLTKKN